MSNNSIQVIPRENAVVVQMILDGKPASWIEFDLQQLDGLIGELEKARAILRKLLLEK